MHSLLQATLPPGPVEDEVDTYEALVLTGRVSILFLYPPPPPLYKPRPCPNYNRRRDRINLVLWRSLYKGGAGYLVDD